MSGKIGARGPERERFEAKVRRSDGCWTWTASHNGVGYGQFYLAGGKKAYAHRYAYEAYVGPIAEGLTLDHLCRNPSCVRPDHLEPVTHRENCLRGFGYPAAHHRGEDCGGAGCPGCRRHRIAERAA